ncbi:MAG: TetR/AcrR family transcriptional regulator [Prevotella sp.]|nr:TetR/AcrR family transcriptional regulator [Prevotella sp.]
MYKSNSQTEYRLELRQKILETATREFQTKGIKAVKMDDIANLLSVSKRTVYEIYDNKEQLLMESVKEEHKCYACQMHDFVENGNPQVMDILLEFYRLQMRNLANVNPIYFEELHRYPQIVAWLENKHKENDQNAQLFFTQGIKDGFFRSDVNYDLITRVGSGMMNYIMENQLYKIYDITEIFRNVIMLFIRGFCTMKGIEELERLLSETKK